MVSWNLREMTVVFSLKRDLDSLYAPSFNPLSPEIKMDILLTVLHTFLMELIRRICLNINTSYP